MFSFVFKLNNRYEKYLVRNKWDYFWKSLKSLGIFLRSIVFSKNENYDSIVFFYVNPVVFATDVPELESFVCALKGVVQTVFEC